MRFPAQHPPVVLTLLKPLQWLPMPPVTHHPFLSALVSLRLCLTEASSLFLTHATQAPDLGPLRGCVWLIPSSPLHLCLKNLYTNVHSSSVRNCRKVEATQVSIDR